jgi:OOP family OmpA-OmpF porin
MQRRFASLLVRGLAIACGLASATPAARAADEVREESVVSETVSAEQNPHYIDVLGSFVRPDSGRNTRSRGHGATLLYGAHLDGPFWVEGRLMGSIFETGSHRGTDFYHYGGGVDLVATWGDRTSWTPFALVGVGGVQDDVQPDSDDSFEFRGDVGLGIVSPAFTSRGLQLRAEGRGLFDTFESGQTDWQVSLGISIPLGRREVVERVVVREVVREVPVAVADRDSDLDGIFDRLDQCPNTLAEAQVDATGCLIREAQTIVLADVHFEFDSARLTTSSERVLDEIVASLRVEKEIRFEIAGHSDSVGSDDYNDRLSQARAQSVMRYLAGRGLDRERMTARGYGERQPIDTNDTDEGRARNRRVEFRFHERSAR